MRIMVRLQSKIFHLAGIENFKNIATGFPHSPAYVFVRVSNGQMMDPAGSHVTSLCQTT